MGSNPMRVTNDVYKLSSTGELFCFKPIDNQLEVLEKQDVILGFNGLMLNCSDWKELERIETYRSLMLPVYVIGNMKMVKIFLIGA